MDEETRWRWKIKSYLLETLFALFFLCLLVILKFADKISERTFLVGMILWGLLTPSPHQWFLAIGNWIKAKKNGGVMVEVEKSKSSSTKDVENEKKVSDVENAEKGGEENGRILHEEGFGGSLC